MAPETNWCWRPAAIAGVDRVFAIGGAQAVGALAYGTATVPQVDKIVGPGNAYVAAAKRRVFGTVGIDMIAGPSEILVLCDGTTDPDWIAMDLFSQAEHDELAQSILVCPDEDYLARVEFSINRLLPQMPRQDIIRASLTHRGAMIKVRDMEQACDIANLIAPEHLEISTESPQRWADRVRHAGAMFLGRFSSESLGDYCAGPNHVLPTSRTARFFVAAGRLRFPEAFQHHLRQRSRRANAGQGGIRTGARRRAGRPCAQRRFPLARKMTGLGSMLKIGHFPDNSCGIFFMLPGSIC